MKKEFSEHPSENEYFDWMISLIDGGRPRRRSYDILLSALYNIEYISFLPMDANRMADGMALRRIFEYETGIQFFSEEEKREPCSMLEMMVALARRCEISIMDDPDEGDRTGLWFWNMIRSLGLIEFTDTKYKANMEYATNCVSSNIDSFLNQSYEYNGSGGLYTVKNPPDDMRKQEIWTQMHWFLNENYNN